MNTEQDLLRQIAAAAAQARQAQKLYFAYRSQINFDKAQQYERRLDTLLDTLHRMQQPAGDSGQLRTE